MASTPRLLLVAALLLASHFPASGQPRLAISKSPTNVTVSWTNRGTLQAASSLTGAWKDLHEAPNPFRFVPTNQARFFRGISRWSTRSNLLAANSEMSVAELDGKIYVMGGYPASRVTVRTV